MRITEVAPIFTLAVVATAVIAVYARAEQPTQAGSARPLVSANPASECQLSGKPSLPLDVIIYAKDKGDAENARFTGMTTGLTVVELPESMPRRAHVVTGTGQGGFAIDGWVNAEALPLYATANLPVIAGHVWISASQRVEFEGRQHNQVRVQRTTTSPFSQAFSATATCNNLSLTPVAAPPQDIPRFARGYSLDHNELAISNDPKGESTFKLQRSNVTTSVFLYGMDQKDDWVHIRHFGVHRHRCLGKARRPAAFTKGRASR